MKIITVLFLFFTVFSYSQENDSSYITEYHRLISKKPDSAFSLSNRLISEKSNEKKAFGFAGKAYFYTLKSDFEQADIFFKKALLELNRPSLRKKIELRGNVLYLQSLRYIESHELETCINILNKTLNLCSENCSFILENRIQSTLARAYSLSNKHIKALEISTISLAKIRKTENYSTNYNLKKEYIKELVKASNRSMNLYYSDKQKYKSYLDSTKHYSVLAENYSKEYQISDYNVYVSMIHADINFQQLNYKIAMQYCEDVLKFFKKRGSKKKIAQTLFRIAECHYHLNENNKAETIFLRQLEDNIWTEFQLLKNEADCYFYLFKINAKKGETKKALNYANRYDEKVKEYHVIKNANDLSVNDIVNNEEKKKEIDGYLQKYKLQERQKKIYLYLLFFLTVIASLLTAYFFHTKRRDKRNISQLSLRIEQLQHDVSKQNISKTSSLSDEKALKLIQKLKALEKEELFQQPNYTLNMVAKKLQTNSSYLSKTVNEYLDVTFAEYSNRLKINAIVLKLKAQKSLQNYTIDALAQEAGYKSVNSFNTNFKKLLKVTPSQYLKEIKE